MKHLKIASLILLGIISTGCVHSTSPVSIENAFQRKVITPCDNDIFCLRDSYSTTWDTTYSNCVADNCGYRPQMLPNYPVTYKKSEYIVETGSDGYRIQMPSGGTIKH